MRQDFHILDNNRFVVAVFGIAVLIVGQHADLSHSDDVAVHCGRREEGVENLIDFLRRKYQRIVFVVVRFSAAGTFVLFAGGKHEHT